MGPAPAHKGHAPLAFAIEGEHENGLARAGTLTVPHFACRTPMFMPVGTQGTIKGLTTAQLRELECQVILGNTYHLGNRPGEETMRAMGGLHRFMNWDRGLLTDSGGFQMVSLLKLAEITEEGVTFEAPHDGSKMVLTPEKSMQIQNAIGADIMMVLDDVVSSTTTGPRVEEAMHRTIRWLDRCIAAHASPETQCLFPIIQGGLDPDLRRSCVAQILERKPLGIAIGGLSGGEEKDAFWRVVLQCTRLLPKELPRYLMGVGYPLDLVVCAAMGVDMFDCVYPTRTARFGTAMVWDGQVQVKQKECADDPRPVDPTCDCRVCKTYSRSFLHHAMGRGDVGISLLTYHNIAHQMRLMTAVRTAIVRGELDAFVSDFLRRHYPKGDYPQWALDALTEAGIKLDI